MIYCYGSNVCVCLKFLCCSPNPSMMECGSGAFGVWWGLDEGMGFVFQSPFSFLTLWAHSRRHPSTKQEEGSHQNLTKMHPDLRLPTPGDARRRHLLFKPPSPFCSILLVEGHHKVIPASRRRKQKWPLSERNSSHITRERTHWDRRNLWQCFAFNTRGEII